MANAHNEHAEGSHGSVKSYAIGFVLSVILTLIPFGLVMYPTLPKDMTVLIVVAFAVIQIVVHLYYFLHLDRSPEQRENVSAFLFTGLVIALLVGLSLWIMFSIPTSMMAKCGNTACPLSTLSTSPNRGSFSVPFFLWQAVSSLPR